MTDDKPKRTKSWREIDKMRNKSGSTQKGDRDAERFQQSTKYTQYKTNLDRLFGGGVPLPDALAQKLDPTGEQSKKDDERKKLFAIEDTKLFNAAAAEYAKVNDLPDDARLLDRLLGHHTFPAQLVSVGAAATVGGFIYLRAVLRMGIPEARQVRRLVLARFERA